VSTGRLIVVPTPIGNLEDITLRAKRMLGEADAVVAEDTRVSGRLLQHLGITKPLVSFHTANEHRVVEQLVQRMARGEVLALVSDAGTPGISDPGLPTRSRGIASRYRRGMPAGSHGFRTGAGGKRSAVRAVRV
jgi:16S rRNA (cytidine(1402)-2'-O)-methyltransferase